MDYFKEIDHVNLGSKKLQHQENVKPDLDEKHHFRDKDYFKEIDHVNLGSK